MRYLEKFRTAGKKNACAYKQDKSYLDPHKIVDNIVDIGYPFNEIHLVSP